MTYWLKAQVRCLNWRGLEGLTPHIAKARKTFMLSPRCFGASYTQSSHQLCYYSISRTVFVADGVYLLFRTSMHIHRPSWRHLIVVTYLMWGMHPVLHHRRSDIFAARARIRHASKDAKYNVLAARQAYISRVLCRPRIVANIVDAEMSIKR